MAVVAAPCRSVPTSGAIVYYDDCEHATGTMIDAKGPGYASLLSFATVGPLVAEKLLDESARQLAALSVRQLRWYFAEPDVAEIVRKLFRDQDAGRERIEIVAKPWP